MLVTFIVDKRYDKHRAPIMIEEQWYEIVSESLSPVAQDTKNIPEFHEENPK